MRFFMAVIALTSLAGCVTRNVVPAQLRPTDSICIIVNRAVKLEFAETYLAQAKKNGYNAMLVDSAANTDSCSLTSTYTAKWGFHYGEYLAMATIEVKRADETIGQALYKVPHLSPAKHGRIGPKIERLVNELLPPKGK